MTIDANAFLASDAIIDWRETSVYAKAKQLAAVDDPIATARRCYLFVRDEIRHSGDSRDDTVTCRASDVLRHETGWCFAKSHLLAALLRANGIAAGLVYQRLSLSGDGAPYCLHGLCAVHLPSVGWHRVDARGNKEGVDADFTPPVERLEFSINDGQECDVPGIWPEPPEAILQCLTQSNNCESVLRNLPDIDKLPAHAPSPSPKL